MLVPATSPGRAALQSYRFSGGTSGKKVEGDVHLPVIRNSFVPQDEQVPVSALRPFFRVTIRGELISLLFFSFTQNAVVITISA
jgi:hypothetical protein